MESKYMPGLMGIGFVKPLHPLNHVYRYSFHLAMSFYFLVITYNITASYVGRSMEIDVVFEDDTWWD